MDLGLAGRVALVTGGSKGIGSRDRGGRWSAEGAKVAVASRDAERIEAAAARIGALRRRLRLGRPGRRRRGRRTVERELGPVDIYVANTGGPPAGTDPLGFTREQWEAAHRTLVLSPMAFLERLLPGMRERGWGRVLAIASIAVREPLPTSSSPTRTAPA